MPANMPFTYDYLNVFASAKSPSTIHCDSELSRFFRRYLFQKAISVFKWEMPDTWKKDYFLYCLYGIGYIAVINTDKFGVIPQFCTLSGYDAQYQPTHANIANPLIKIPLRPRIGLDCELIKLQPDYGGIMDLVAFHGDMMALCAQGAGINELNSRLAYVFGSDNKAGAETFKKLFDTIAKGDPAAVTDKNFFGDDGKPRWALFTQNIAQNYIAGQQLENMRRWEQNYDKEIGIPWANTGNLERANSEYIMSNRAETASRCDMILGGLKESCQRVNDMFGDAMEKPLSVEWRYDPTDPGLMEGGAENARNTFNTGANGR